MTVSREEWEKAEVVRSSGDGENRLVLATRGAHVKNGLDSRVDFIVGSADEIPVPDASVPQACAAVYRKN